MGIDVTGISNVEVRVIPYEHYRVAQEDGSLAHRPESLEWIRTVEEDDRFIRFNWKAGVVYMRTEASVECHAACSYGGFAHYNEQVIATLLSLGKRLRFRVPDTDFEPWDGIIRGDLLAISLADYRLARDHTGDEEDRSFANDFVNCLERASDRGLLLIH